MSTFWKKVASERGDAGVREALGAVHALAEEACKSSDWSYVQRILDVIQAEMLPKERPSKPPILSPVEYAGCKSGICKKPKEVRGLYEVAGRNVCISCRKLAQKWLAREFGLKWWTAPAASQAVVWEKWSV